MKCHSKPAALQMALPLASRETVDDPRPSRSQELKALLSEMLVRAATLHEHAKEETSNANE